MSDKFQACYRIGGILSIGNQAALWFLTMHRLGSYLLCDRSSALAGNQLVAAPCGTHTIEYIGLGRGSLKGCMDLCARRSINWLLRISVERPTCKDISRPNGLPIILRRIRMEESLAQTSKDLPHAGWHRHGDRRVCLPGRFLSLL